MMMTVILLMMKIGDEKGTLRRRFAATGCLESDPISGEPFKCYFFSFYFSDRRECFRRGGWVSVAVKVIFTRVPIISSPIHSGSDWVQVLFQIRIWVLLRVRVDSVKPESTPVNSVGQRVKTVDRMVRVRYRDSFTLG
ncbi:hypothetical protein Hanom_Chr11g01014731 [Helianthus anomalus]